MMVSLKLYNINSSMLRGLIMGCIPAEKQKKVSVVAPADASKIIAENFEPHQVEARYGGTAPDSSPEMVYPFKFFSNCTGKAATRGDQGAGGTAAPEDTSLHAFSARLFHEGVLWDDSTEAAKGRWRSAA